MATDSGVSEGDKESDTPAQAPAQAPVDAPAVIENSVVAEDSVVEAESVVEADSVVVEDVVVEADAIEGLDEQGSTVSAEQALDEKSEDAALDLIAGSTSAGSTSAGSTSAGSTLAAEPLANDELAEGADIDAVRVVEAVIDRRSPEVDHPLPRHPMDAVVSDSSLSESASVAEPHGTTVETTVEISSTTVDVDVEVDVEAVESVDTLDALVVMEAAETVEAAETAAETRASPATVLSQSVGATDSSADEQMELRRQLQNSQHQQAILEAQVKTLTDELNQTKIQLSQARSQILDQNKDQQEIAKLKSNLAAVQDDLDDARACILRLTKAPSSQPSQSGGHRQPRPDSEQRLPSQRSSVLPSPRRSPQPLPQGRSVRPSRESAPIRAASLPSPSRDGLPPMSTDRLAASTPLPSPSSQRLRPAYKRPGFSTPSSSGSSSSDPQPAAQYSRQRGVAPSPLPPLRSEQSRLAPSSSPASPATSASPERAITSQRQTRELVRRSRPFDDLKPQLDSSDMPQPKVSDAEIGWFD